MSKHILVIEKGRVRALYTPELRPYAEATGAEIRRATWIEPMGWFRRWVFHQIRKRVSDEGRLAAWTRMWKCSWRANLDLSGGPITGPFQTRQAAIEFETSWLTQKWLLRGTEKDNACTITEGR